jgi:large repetitive protein
MVKRQKPTSTFYSYSTKRSLRQEELSAYRRIIIATVLIILLIVGGYFLGVPLLANLGNNSQNIGNPQLTGQDKVAPAPPTINSLPNEVRTKTITITGSAESGATVTITVNDEESAKTLADKQGHYEGEVALAGGSNTISAQAKDAAGNQSRASTNISITYDATPPNISLLQELPQLATEPTLTVTGKTEPKAKVTINDRVAIVNNEGVFTTTIRLISGANTISIIATDAAGNQKKIERTVTLNNEQSSSSATPQ